MATMQRKVRLENGQTKTITLTARDPEEVRKANPPKETKPQIEEHTRGGKVDVAEDHRPMEVYDDASQPTDAEE